MRADELAAVAGEPMAAGGADLLVMVGGRFGICKGGSAVRGVYIRTTLRDGGGGCRGIESARTLGQHARQISMVGGSAAAGPKVITEASGSWATRKGMDRWTQKPRNNRIF